MKNYKTTITGFILAAFIAAQPIVENGDFEFKRDWLKLLFAIGIATFGLSTKDHNTTT